VGTCPVKKDTVLTKIKKALINVKNTIRFFLNKGNEVKHSKLVDNFCDFDQLCLVGWSFHLRVANPRLKKLNLGKS
jgi:hypothetical protein